MKRFTLLSVSSLACMISACGGITKNMDDMNASTSKLSATTSGMANSTDHLAKTNDQTAVTLDGLAKTTLTSVGLSKKMSLEMGFTYTDMRTSNTREARQDALDGMEKSADASAKLGYASEYFGAMDFQFWKAEADSLADREAMEALAVRDFFRKVHPYIVDHETVDPLDPALIANPKFQNFAALAATLHYINLAQAAAVNAKPGLKMESMLSLIEEGLSAKTTLELSQSDETSLPAPQAEVLRNEQDAIYLLRVRQNSLKAMAIALSASTANGDDFSHNTDFLKSITDPTHPQWIPNYDSRNPAELNYIAAIFKYALDTQIFLSGMSIDPQTAPSVTGALALINNDSVNRTQPAKAKALDRIIQMIGGILRAGAPKNALPAGK